MADALFSSLYDLDEYEYATEKIDLDELFDKRRVFLQKEVDTYKKILARIHHRIKITSRQRTNNDFTTFIFPEFIMGLPRFDLLGCIGYCIEKLKENGFLVRYTHPNMLFISWRHYIPSYERDLIKSRLGIKVDEKGNIVGKIGEKGEGSTGRLKTRPETASREENDLMLFSKRDSRDYRDSRDSFTSSSGDIDARTAGASASSNSRVRFADSGSSGNTSSSSRHYRDISSYEPKGIYNRDYFS